MSFIREQELLKSAMVPMCCPSTIVPANGPGLPLAQFRLKSNEVLRLGYWCLNFLSFRTIGHLGRVTSSLPIVYVGIYYQAEKCGDLAPSTPILHMGLDIPGFVAHQFFQNETFSSPGIYRVLLVNNHASASIEAIVTGAGSIQLT